MKRSKILLILPFLIFLLLLGNVILWMKFGNGKKQTLPIIGKIGNALFKEAGGRNFEIFELRGKIWVGTLFFSYCTGPCPLVSRNMKELQREFGSSLTLVSFSVDPLNDTPERLSQYARQLGADLSHWYFLTGSKETLYYFAATDLKLAVGKSPEELTHSTKLFLVDPKGRIRGYFEGTSVAELPAIKNAIAFLLNETE